MLLFGVSRSDCQNLCLFKESLARSSRYRNLFDLFPVFLIHPSFRDGLGHPKCGLSTVATAGTLEGVPENLPQSGNPGGLYAEILHSSCALEYRLILISSHITRENFSFHEKQWKFQFLLIFAPATAGGSPQSSQPQRCCISSLPIAKCSAIFGVPFCKPLLLDSDHGSIFIVTQRQSRSLILEI